ncbi:unnamed protein product [Phyllotreta striolata]|uniref:Ubiquinone biosynthesis O-methyltransferase, mitochondrial n=1 Tax=Phyllotreta striolata TaxID=444603 RepID=A0A9N9TVN4_PHYSR|nr:unnamed protein product [Phyllotreta striolata]
MAGNLLKGFVRTQNFKCMVKIRLYSSGTSTIDDKEVVHFKKFVSYWWDEFGEFKPLHSMNKIRIPWIRDCILANNEMKDASLPLKGYSVLDVGCGGGILSEPLSRIGADVTGLDANEDLIKAAKAHAELTKANVNYVASSVEDHARENFEKYDAVVSSEVIEHVTQKEEFVKACVECLKPNGSIFFTTISKTKYASFLAIYLGENVIKGIPKGTHHYEKFITPHELQRILEKNNCRTDVVHGTIYNFLTNTWSWWFNSDFTYVLKATKLDKQNC